MADSFTEYSHEGYGSRVGGSIKGVFFGLIFFIGSFFLLGWNESRAIKQTNSLLEGKANVVGVDAQAVTPGQEGKLVYLTGQATTTELLNDETFGITATALKLRRVVEMYQWEEDKDTEKSSNGDRRTTYTYRKKWDDSEISSSDFKHPENHTNPAMPFRSSTETSPNITIGARQLSPGLASQIREYSPLPVSSADLQKAPMASGKQPRLDGAGYYYGRDPSNPEVGDLRVRFEVVKPLDVSLVAKQLGSTFGPYLTSVGNEIELLEEGIRSSDYIFDAALKRNMILTWAIRAGGWLLMCLGLAMMLGPITAVLSFLPILPNVVGLGIGIAAFVLGTVLSILTIAICWFAVRPMAAGIAIVLCGVLIWSARNRGAKKIAQVGGPSLSAPPPVPPPPPPRQ